MAERYGETVNLRQEIMRILEETPAGAPMNKWLIRDTLDGAWAISFSEEELKEALSSIEDRYGVTFPEGSLVESMQGGTPLMLLHETLYRNKNSQLHSKLDEIIFEKQAALKKIVN